MVDVKILDQLIDKAELRGISKEFAQQIVEEYLEENPKTRERMQTPNFMRSKEYKHMKKEVRAQLRKLYGVFFKSNYSNKREEYIQQLIQEPNQENALQVLEIHRSTKERIEHYDFLHKQLQSYIGDVKSILDLGCGFNPFSYPYLPGKPEYYCADIACQDLKLIEQFLQKVAPKSKTWCIDLSEKKHLEDFPEVDLVYAFKVFDSLEDRERDITKYYLDNLKAKYIIVSFPLASISGKNEIKTRNWFDELVSERELVRVTLPNEQFIIVTGKQLEKVTDRQQ